MDWFSTLVENLAFSIGHNAKRNQTFLKSLHWYPTNMGCWSIAMIRTFNPGMVKKKFVHCRYYPRRTLNLQLFSNLVWQTRQPAQWDHSYILSTTHQFFFNYSRENVSMKRPGHQRAPFYFILFCKSSKLILTCCCPHPGVTIMKIKTDRPHPGDHLHTPTG